MEKYKNRQEAGRELVKHLKSYANRKDVLVLALPRGGVPVAFEIAHNLNLPLDVFIVRKLGVPSHSELAFGAIATGDVVVYNEEIAKSLSQKEKQTVMEEEKLELNRREIHYRGQHVLPVIRNKTIILVDDGVATGATLRAAIYALKKLEPARIIVAVPVAQNDLVKELTPLVNQFICPLKPNQLQAVGRWYEDFSQTEDEEVRTLLKKVRQHFALN